MNSQNPMPETPERLARDFTAPAGDPSNRHRRLLYAATPFVLLVVITGAMRFVAGTDAADTEQSRRFMSQPVQTTTDFPKSSSGQSGGAQPSRVADMSTAKRVTNAVSGQLNAIQSGDFKAALVYATPETRHSVSPDAFAQMIQRGYRPMLRASKTEFGPVRVSEDSAMVTVILKPASGAQTLYRYLLSLSDDKRTWFVSGVSEDIVPGIGDPNYSIPGPPPDAGRMPMRRPF